MNRLYKFINLSFKEKKLLGESLFLLIVIRLSLSLLPFRWLNKYLSGSNLSNSSCQEADWIVVNQVIDSVRVCSRYIPRATCLTQSIAARTLLRSRGQSSELKIGVTKGTRNNLEAHAWIEIDERIVIGKLPLHRQRFTVLKVPDLIIL